MNPSSPIVPVILVGCGAVSRQFYRPALSVLQHAGLFRVRALVDPSAESRATLAAAFPDAEQWDSLASRPGLDGALVVVASPPRFHAEQTIMALQAGAHVLCEKPIANQVDEAEAMVAAATAADRLLAVGLYKRFFPASQYLRQLVSSGQLGSLISFTISEGGPFRWPAASPSFFDRRPGGGGGVLLDIGVHVLDLVGWWFGEAKTIDYADDARGGVEANAFVSMTFPQGATGRIHLSRDWPTNQAYRFHFEGGDVEWTVNDANGLTVRLRNTPAKLKATLCTTNDAPTDPRHPVPQATNAQSFLAQLQNVHAAIAGREPLLVPGNDSVRVLRWIDQCYAHRQTVSEPWTELETTGGRRSRSPRRTAPLSA